MDEGDIRYVVERLRTLHTGMDDFIQYLIGYWMPRMQMWRVEKVDFDVLTNCALEGNHARLNKRAPGAHPNLTVASETLFDLDHHIIEVNELGLQSNEFHSKAKTRTEDFYSFAPCSRRKWDHLLDNFDARDAALTAGGRDWSREAYAGITDDTTDGEMADAISTLLDVNVKD